MGVVRLDHTAVAVRDLRGALGLWGDMLGGTLAQAKGEWQGFGFVQLTYPERGRIELIFPTGDGETFLTRFLERRGEGLHHMTFMVDDLEREIARFRDQGYAVVDEDLSDPHWQEAFLSPRGTYGALIQLAASDLDQAGQDAYWHDDLERVIEIAARHA
jgi:methylmalonyl-CoA/ethylmalonyl-CoA epimerase